MTIGMIILLIGFLVIAAGFWGTVSKQARLVKEEEQKIEDMAITAVYMEYGEFLKQGFFMNLETEMLFTANVPREGIYNKNDHLIPGDVLEVGDIVKIYGDGAITLSIPGNYPGVTKMKRAGRATLEEVSEYQKVVDGQMKGQEIEE